MLPLPLELAAWVLSPAWMHGIPAHYLQAPYQVGIFLQNHAVEIPAFDGNTFSRCKALAALPGEAHAQYKLCVHSLY